MKITQNPYLLGFYFGCFYFTLTTHSLKISPDDLFIISKKVCFQEDDL